MVKRIPTDMIEDRVSGQKLSTSLADKANKTDCDGYCDRNIKKYSNRVANSVMEQQRL
jgi:hypothetical protein